MPKRPKAAKQETVKRSRSRTQTPLPTLQVPEWEFSTEMDDTYPIHSPRAGTAVGDSTDFVGNPLYRWRDDPKVEATQCERRLSQKLTGIANMVKNRMCGIPGLLCVFAGKAARDHGLNAVSTAHQASNTFEHYAGGLAQIAAEQMQDPEVQKCMAGVAIGGNLDSQVMGRMSSMRDRAFEKQALLSSELPWWLATLFNKVTSFVPTELVDRITEHEGGRTCPNMQLIKHFGEKVVGDIVDGGDVCYPTFQQLCPEISERVDRRLDAEMAGFGHKLDIQVDAVISSYHKMLDSDHTRMGVKKQLAGYLLGMAATAVVLWTATKAYAKFVKIKACFAVSSKCTSPRSTQGMAVSPLTSSEETSDYWTSSLPGGGRRYRQRRSAKLKKSKSPRRRHRQHF